MSESIPLPTETQINAQTLLEALPLLESPLVLTQDELLCVRILREAFEDIVKGGDISPAPEGTQKFRLIRRLSVGFFTPNAPRPHNPEQIPISIKQ